MDLASLIHQRSVEQVGQYKHLWSYFTGHVAIVCALAIFQYHSAPASTDHLSLLYLGLFVVSDTVMYGIMVHGLNALSQFCPALSPAAGSSSVSGKHVNVPLYVSRRLACSRMVLPPYSQLSGRWRGSLFYGFLVSAVFYFLVGISYLTPTWVFAFALLVHLGVFSVYSYCLYKMMPVVTEV